MVLHSDLELKFLFGNIGDEQKRPNINIAKNITHKMSKNLQELKFALHITILY